MTNKMPVLFVGHGSPMNAIEDNSFTKNWEKIAAHIPKPEAILSVSAHWYTRGSKIMNNVTAAEDQYTLFAQSNKLLSNFEMCRCIGMRINAQLKNWNIGFGIHLAKNRPSTMINSPSIIDLHFFAN